MRYQIENLGGTYDFRGFFHDYFILPTHIHEYSEIFVVLEGSANLMIAGKFYTLKANQVALILPNQLHSYNCKNLKCYCAVFSNDFITAFFSSINSQCFENPVLDLSDDSDLLNALCSMEDSNLILVTAYLNLLCNKFLENATLIEKISIHDNELLQKVITYLSKHYTENITLKNVADKLNFNEKYLSSTLHSLTGVNFRTILAQYRIKHAKDMMLKSKRDSISSIAYASGFNSINSFNRAFMRLVGESPTEYRNSINKK